MPAPVCKSQDYKLSSLDGIKQNTEYLGDSSKSNWVVSGEPKVYTDNGQDVLLLTMKQGTVGTLLASTNYVWYGKVSATLKTSRTAGVVTAFILLSDVKDEIDFEFVGTDLNTAQSNYYFQGVTDCKLPVLPAWLVRASNRGFIDHQGVNISAADTFNTYHKFEIDWTPDSITWSIDGTAYRTRHRADTWNATDNQWHFPQTPARIQLSLWPAGLNTNGKGTVDWAGGLVDWSAPDSKNAGYFYAMVSEVTVECYQPPAGAQASSGRKSYVYNQLAGTNDTVAITDRETVLKSQLGSGTNMSADFPKVVVVSGTGSAVGPAATSDIPTIPGLTGAGTGTNGQRGGGGGADGGAAGSGLDGSGTSGSSPSSVSSASTATGSDFHGFSQNGNGVSGAGRVLRTVGGGGVMGLFWGAVALGLGGMVVL